MIRSYACIISPDPKRDRDTLVAVADKFAYSIEVIEDGILFDVSGLERLIGDHDSVGQKILAELEKHNIRGSVGIAETVEAAAILARHDAGVNTSVRTSGSMQKLPLAELPIEQDTLNVFEDLGVRNVQQLLDVPNAELIGRYGREFQKVIDIIERKDRRLLAPNVKEDRVAWDFLLDSPVEDVEQLIFILNHGLDRLFGQVAHCGFSTEHLGIILGLRNKTEKSYEIKTSFPTLERSFWLKLINLRLSLDPPEAGILSVNVIAHFTKPRPSQRGLYAVSRPDPEALLLTVNKLKKLVGEENVGIPVILNQRLAEPFALESDAIPQGIERIESRPEKPVIAFTYFRPPMRVEVLVKNGRLVFVKTRHFGGHVRKYSGVWKANSKWWGHSWKTQEWDVEIEEKGIYRLCKIDKDWFLAGEYD